MPIEYGGRKDAYELVAAPVTLCVKGHESTIIISADLKECLSPEELIAIDLLAASQGIRGVQVEGETYFFKPTLGGVVVK